MHNATMRGTLACAIVTGAFAMLAGCGGAQGITADTKCSDYLQFEGQQRYDAAVRISAATDGVSSPGNPMWALSLDAACGSSPNMTIGEYFGRAS